MKSFKITIRLIVTFTLLSVGTITLQAQQKVGLNTVTPIRNLEMRGVLSESMRIQSTSIGNTEVALELLLGNTNDAAVDYKLSNDGGVFKVESGVDNFVTVENELWRINANGQWGIGTTVPTSQLHIDGGEEASNTDDGYLLIGNKSSSNLVMDRNEILSRNNGNTNSMSIQSNGGATYIGTDGGDVSFAAINGKLGIGTTSTAAKLSLEADDFQLHLRNTLNGTRHWYIGASNDNWVAGGNQLLFSPGGSSDDAILRLADVSDNNGTDAPVMIRSSATQTLLLDGNEIDSRDGPLYINYNSDQDTYINPSGGQAAIGTNSPSTTFQIKSNDADIPCLKLAKGGLNWTISPNTSFHTLQFFHGISLLAHVDGSNGQWVVASDRRLKTDIETLSPVMEKVNRLKVYTYNFKHDPTASRQVGLIAQELQTEFPEIVNEGDHQYSVTYSKLSVILLKAIQEQQTVIDELQTELNQLVSKLHP